MKLEVNIDDESIDEVVRQNLIWHIKNAKLELNRFKKIEHITSSQKEELEYLTKLLPALNMVGEYFGVNTNDKRRNK